MSRKPAKNRLMIRKRQSKELSAAAQRAHAADVQKPKPEVASRSCELPPVVIARLGGFVSLWSTLEGLFIGAFKCMFAGSLVCLDTVLSSHLEYLPNFIACPWNCASHS